MSSNRVFYYVYVSIFSDDRCKNFMHIKADKRIDHLSFKILE